MKTILFVTAILFAAACGGKSKGGGGDPCADPCKDKKMAAMTCDGMADNVAKSMEGMGDMGEEEIAQARTILVDQCSSTAWSQETIDCMGAATGPDTADACVEMMSEEQKSSFMDSMNGGGGEDEEGME